MEQKPGLSHGLPESWADFTKSKQLQTLYGNFAIGVFSEIRELEPELPLDLVTVGDNWYQLVELHDFPTGELQTELAKMGGEIFGDMWQLMERDENFSLETLLEHLGEGVKANTLDEEIIKRLTILDRTSIAFPLNTNGLQNVETTSWGLKGTMKNTHSTKLYIIQKGFRRHSQTQLRGNPGDDFDVSIHNFEK